MLLTLLTFDKTLFLWCNRFQHQPVLMRFFRQVSRTGDGYLYALLAVLVWWAKPAHASDFVITGLLAFLIEIPLFITLKKSIRRDRPCVGIEGALSTIVPADKFSLPSGHSAAAFVMAGVIAGFYPLLALPALLWAGLIGVSRVMLGVHYPSDIIAGAALGLSCALLAFSLPL